MSVLGPGRTLREPASTECPAADGLVFESQAPNFHHSLLPTAVRAQADTQEQLSGILLAGNKAAEESAKDERQIPDREGQVLGIPMLDVGRENPTAASRGDKTDASVVDTAAQQDAGPEHPVDQPPLESFASALEYVLEHLSEIGLAEIDR